MQPHSLRGYKTYKCRCNICVAAHTRHRAEQNYKNRRTPINYVLISGEPLAKIFRERLMSGGSMSKHIQRWENQGISVYEADKWCNKLGYHPFEVFGSAYFQGLEQEEEEYIELYGEFEQAEAERTQ